MSGLSKNCTKTFQHAGNVMIRIVTSIVFLAVSTSGSEVGLYAAELPFNWPWRGVVVNSFETTPKDVDFLKEYLGINHLSLHLKTRLRAKRFKMDPEKAWKDELQWSDSMLDACKRIGITATVASSNFPIDPGYGLNQSSPGFWNSKKHINDLFDRVAKLNNHFKDRSIELSAFEILAEPLLRDGNNLKIPDNWPEVLDRIIRIIRKQDPDRWVVIAPGPGGQFSGYLKLKKLEHPRIIYAAHAYQPHSFTHQGIKNRPMDIYYPGKIHFKNFDKEYLRSIFQPLRDFQQQYNVPVWIGEFSAVRWAKGAENYIKDAVSIFEEYGWSWSYFQYKGYHGWNPDYNAKFSNDDRKFWSKEYVGLSSLRWNTLREIFDVESAKDAVKKPDE